MIFLLLSKTTISIFAVLFVLFLAFFIWRIIKSKHKNPQTANSSTISPADFELNLLSLCALVIRADGASTKKELDYVRDLFVRGYGKERANETFRLFSQLNKTELSLERIALYVRVRTNYESRLEIIHFLFKVAEIDGSVQTEELKQIHRIAYQFNVFPLDFESIKAMFYKSIDDDYKILGINAQATDAEVKKAFREMAKKYHPDRIATQDAALKKGAEEKFKKVQQAYENIMKKREQNS